MNAEKLKELQDCIKHVLRAQESLEKHSATSRDMNATHKRRTNANESAREAAIEVRHWKHEMHCIAVELGIADRRADEHYADSVAPAGFGREMVFSKRAPVVTGKGSTEDLGKLLFGIETNCQANLDSSDKATGN